MFGIEDIITIKDKEINLDKLSVEQLEKLLEKFNEERLNVIKGQNKILDEILNNRG